MKFTKIKIGDLQHLEFHASIPLGLWIKLNGQKIPVGIEGNKLSNRVTASQEKYPIIDIVLSDEEKQNILNLYPAEEKVESRQYVPGVGWINPSNIKPEQNEQFKNLKKME